MIALVRNRPMDASMPGVVKKPGRLLRRLTEPFGSLPLGLSALIGVSVWAGLLALWAGASYGGWVDPLFMPTPGRVIDAVVGFIADGTLWINIWSSLEVVLLGFLSSSLLALPLGLIIGSYPIARAATDPVVSFIRYLPVTSFVPLFILWIGIGLEQRVTVIFFGTFFAQLVMFAASARAVPRDLINAAYTLGTRRRDVVWQIVLPAALPGVIDALRVTVGWAWTYLVVAELVAADSGLGYMSLKALRGFQVEVIFMAIGIIGLLGLITDRLFLLTATLLMPWMRER
jgi:NitT/TauT family transport system permease protein